MPIEERSGPSADVSVIGQERKRGEGGEEEEEEEGFIEMEQWGGECELYVLKRDLSDDDSGRFVRRFRVFNF